MVPSLDKNAILLLGVFTLFFVTSASAEWEISVLDQPYSFQNVSNVSNTAQIIELTDSGGTPINESQLVSDSFVQYKYNGSTTDMEWLNNGYWYADFELNHTGGEIEFEAQGETESSLIEDASSEANATRSFNLGNMSVNLINDFSGPVNPEDEFDIQINVTDTVNNTFEDQADLDFYFTNGTWTSEIYNVNNIDDLNDDGVDDHYKNFGLDFDLEYNSEYVLHINATNESNLGYENPYGVQSMAIETFPEIKGNVIQLNASSGCNSESFFTECQRDAEIGTSFNVTSANAENVNLTLEIKDSETQEWENQTRTVLSENNGLYNGSIEVPDINTSSYDKEFRLKYNATNGGREEVVTRVIDYRDFRINDKSDAKTAKGSYRIKLEISKFFTPELLTRDRINDSSISVEEPSGDTLTTFTVEDMERLEGSGHYKRKINIPLDAEEGIYSMDAEVENLYNETKSETFNFNVTDVRQTFTLNEGEENFEQSIDKTGNRSYNITLQNDLDSETNLSTEVSGDIEEFTEVNEGENITLDPEESRNITLSMNISSVDDYDGEIKFMDREANYNSTLDVEIDHPPCNYRNESVCVLGSNLNTTGDERGEIVKDFTALNYGELNTSYDYSFSLSGNITDYASLEFEETTLNETDDSETVNLTYSVNVPGFYSGTLEVGNSEDNVQIPVSLESNVESTESSIVLSGDIDLGDLREGDSASTELDIENTGDVDVTSLTYESSEYDVSGDSLSISAGSTETVSIDFSEVNTESGELTVTGETSTDPATATVSVSANVVPDYGQKADDYEQRAIDLDSQISSDSEYQTDVNSVQSSISDLRSAFRSGNYERAETLSSDISSTLDNLETEVQSSESEPEPGQGEGGPDGDGSSGGGIPILPIAAVIFVLLIVGFVAFTSIEFERGDPLYNVLGQ